MPRELLMLWCARGTWVVLPVTTGNAIADALDGWSTGPARVAAVLVWVAWAAGVLALLAPRPRGLTLLRVVGPLGLVCVAVSLTSASTASGVIAIASMTLADVCVLSSAVAAASGNALAYGDEVRFPMPVPTPLLFGPVPIAIALVGAGGAAGPLLLADGRIVAGLAAVVSGVPVALLVIRSLDALSRRWVVVVPAGIALVDPLTLADPVLLRREAITRMSRAPASPRPAGILDLRLGTLVGGIEIGLAHPESFGRRRGARAPKCSSRRVLRSRQRVQMRFSRSPRTVASRRADDEPARAYATSSVTISGRLSVARARNTTSRSVSPRT